jgi:hypothetical protein
VGIDTRNNNQVAVKFVEDNAIAENELRAFVALKVSCCVQVYAFSLPYFWSPLQGRCL